MGGFTVVKSEGAPVVVDNGKVNNRGKNATNLPKLYHVIASSGSADSGRTCIQTS